MFYSLPMTTSTELRTDSTGKVYDGVLHSIDATGDTKVLWSKDNPDEVENAAKTFKRLRGKGFLAYSVNEDGTHGELLREFDKRAERIILTPPLVGG